jgi:hypothetical protein
MTDKREKISIKITCAYGIISYSNNTTYDLYDILGTNLLDYKLTKIKCQLKSNKCIYGLQLIYRNKNDGKESTLIDIKSNEQDLIEQEMDLKGEEIKDLRVWLDENTNLIGFEVSTAKRSKKFGYGNDEQLTKIIDFEKLDQIIVGFGFYANEKNGIQSIYAYYISRNEYISYKCDGFFALRSKIKNEDFNKKIKNKLPSMSSRNNILYKICRLPDNQFFNIIKYSIS